MEEKRRRYQRIPRVALLLPKQSAWMKLYSSKDDSALITLTGLDHNAFATLLRSFSDIFDGYSPYSTTGEILKLSNNKRKGGRPRLISAGDCMGLYLAWTRLRGTTVALQMIFGMTASCVAIYLRFARRILIHILSRCPDAAIRIPSPEKIKEYQAKISERHPNLKDVWCTMDGLKIKFILNNRLMLSCKTGFTMVGPVITMSVQSLFFVLMAPSQLLHTMYLDHFTIALLQSGAKYTTNLSMSTKTVVPWESVPWIPHLAQKITIF